MVKDYDYIISKSGSNYYASDGLTGEVKSVNADASTVIQYALTALTTGGTILIKPGIYAVTANLVVGSGIRISGYGAKLTVASDLLHIITITGSGTGASRACVPAYGTNGVATVTSGLAVGDYITLKSSDLWHASWAFSYLGSIHKISRIVDAANLELYDTVPFNYITTPLLYPTTMVTGVTIEGIEIVGAGAYACCYDSGYHGNMGIFATHAADIKIIDCKMSNCSMWGIGISHSVDVETRGCSIHDCHQLGYGHGVTVNDASHDVFISGCTMENCRHGSSNGFGDYGIPYNITYSQCTFRNTESEREHAPGSAIGFDCCLFDNVGNIKIECPDSFITNCIIRGMKYEAPGDPAYNVVSTNVSMIEVGDTESLPANCKIVDNIIEYSATTIVGNYINAISLQLAPGCLVSGNTIRLVSGTAGIYAAAIKIWPVVAFDDITITNNNCLASTPYGIYFNSEQALSRVKITGNTILSTTYAGVYVYGPVTDWLISNNEIKVVDSMCVRLVGPVSKGVISNNIMRSASTTQAAIYTAGICNGIVINGNYIYCPYSAIYIAGGAGTEAYDFTIVGNKLESAAGGYTIRATYAHDVVVAANNITQGDRGVLLQTDAIDFRFFGNNFVGDEANSYEIGATALRATIDGIGLNGANDPDSAGDWSTHDNERVLVKWNNGGTHYLSVCVAGVWYDATVV